MPTRTCERSARRSSPAGDRPGAAPPPRHDAYLDALRAGALLVVVAGHWLATLPRIDGSLRGADHLLAVWPAAGLLTWALQVVPLFVFVSAAVSAHSADRCNTGQTTLATWWGTRALRLLRPTATYLWTLALLVMLASVSAGAADLLAVFDHSLTVHLWFLVMLLCLQACLPLMVAADRRWGLGVVVALTAAAGCVELLRALSAGPLVLTGLGAQVTSVDGGIGWLNMLLIWLVPQQLGIAWRAKRLRAPAGVGLTVLGLLWLVAAVRLGYPTAMVGGDLAGSSNVLPATLALLGVVWLQIGLVVAVEPLAQRLASQRSGHLVGVLTAVGMPLYLWHKLAELPAAYLAGRLPLPVDAGIPGDPGFWVGRAVWILAAAAVVAPMLGAVVAVEGRRRVRVPVTERAWRVLSAGLLALAGLTAALYAGASAAAMAAAVMITGASLLLRAPNLSRRATAASTPRRVRKA